MLKKKFTLFLAGLGISMLAPGQSIASDNEGGDPLDWSREHTAGVQPNVQAMFPRSFEQAARWIDNGKGVAWYTNLGQDEKLACEDYFSKIRGEGPVSGFYEAEIVRSVIAFYDARDIHKFKILPAFHNVINAMSAQDASEFYWRFWSCIPKGMWEAEKYYNLAMRLFTSLQEDERTLESMKRFSDWYRPECGEKSRFHNRKVRWLMIRDLLDALKADETISMEKVTAIFKKPRSPIYLAQGLIESGPREALDFTSSMALAVVYFGAASLF